MAAVDVWSAGATIFQMLMGRQLLNTYLGPGATKLSNIDPLLAIKEKRRRLLDEIHRKCPPPASPGMSAASSDLVRRMLEPATVRRITVEGALHHEWLREQPARALRQMAQ